MRAYSDFKRIWSFTSDRTRDKQVSVFFFSMNSVDEHSLLNLYLFFEFFMQDIRANVESVVPGEGRPGIKMEVFHLARIFLEQFRECARPVQKDFLQIHCSIFASVEFKTEHVFSKIFRIFQVKYHTSSSKYMVIIIPRKRLISGILRSLSFWINVHFSVNFATRQFLPLFPEQKLAKARASRGTRAIDLFPFLSGAKSELFMWSDFNRLSRARPHTTHEQQVFPPRRARSARGENYKFKAVFCPDLLDFCSTSSYLSDSMTVKTPISE